VYFVLLGKTDMFVLLKLFDGSIECKTQAIGRILAALASPMIGWLRCAWAELIAMRFCIVGVLFGDGCAFILGLGGTVFKEHIVTVA
jgi:hypothetical protein